MLFEGALILFPTESLLLVFFFFFSGKAGLESQHFKGKLMIKGIGPGGSSQKLAIPWSAEVLQGGLEINSTVTHYCSPHSNQPRNFSVINRFKVPLAITNVSLPLEAKSFFSVRKSIVLAKKHRASCHWEKVVTMALLRKEFTRAQHRSHVRLVCEC